MKKLKFIPIILLAQLLGCATLPPYLTAIHQQAPKDIQEPSKQVSMLIFEPGHPHTLGLVSFDGKKSKKGLRNYVNGIEFTPGWHSIEVGLLYRYGELNLQLQLSSSFKYNFEAGVKYRVSRSFDEINQFVLHNDDHDELLRF